MQEIKYVDMRIYFQPGVSLEMLGYGNLETSNIMDLAINLQHTILQSSLDDNTKEKLMSLSIGDFIKTVKIVGEQFISAYDFVEAQKPEFVQSPVLTKEHQAAEVVKTFRSRGQCKCPWCGIGVKSLDGKIRCLNCGVDFGELE